MGGLIGKRILITRASGQTESIAKRILQRGGIPVSFPCMAVVCLADSVRRSVSLFEDDRVQVLFTSSNGVHCVAAILGDAFVSTLQAVSVVAIGRHTTDALEALGVQVAWTSPLASQEGLIDTYRQRGLPGRLIFFRAEQGGDILFNALKAMGVDVYLVPAYRTICPDDDASVVIQALKNGKIDAVLLGSARTARHYVQRVKKELERERKGAVSLFRSEESKLPPFFLANRPVMAVISQQVANETRAMGLDVQVVAKEASFASMLDGLEAWFHE